MKYKYLYLPVDKPLTDGCTLLQSDGTILTFDASQHYDLKLEHFRVAEPFLVTFEFNTMVVIGEPSPLVNWLKNGDEAKAVDCRKAYISSVTPPAFVKFSEEPIPGTTVNKEVIRIMCPTCGNLH